MSDARTITCIRCPRGCRVTVLSVDDRKASGQTCKLGLEYALEECRCPRRTVTAVVRTDNEKIRYLPVKTDKPLKKSLIVPLLRQLYTMKVCLPVESGSVIMTDFHQTGVNVVASVGAEPI